MNDMMKDGHSEYNIRKSEKVDWWTYRGPNKDTFDFID